MNGKFLYVFLDEAGNFDFSPGGTKYFILSALSKERPFHAYREMIELKYDLVEAGTDLEFFHASENAQAIRNAVFAVIQRHLCGVRLDSLIVEKRKVHPSLRPPERFFPRMLGYLLRYVLHAYRLDLYREVIVFTDRIPVKNKRKAIEKAAKITLAGMLPGTARYRILHHDSKSNMDLQLVDYFNWAVYRKWDAKDERSHQVIRSAIASEFDFCRTGTTCFY